MITPPQIALVVTNLVTVIGIVYYMSTILGKRIDALDKRLDDLNSNMNARFSEMNANINNRIDDLRTQMQREHDNLAHKVDTLTDTVTAHISDQTIHQPPRV